MNRFNKICSFLLIFIFLLSIINNLTSSFVIAYANSDYEFSGNEDATDLSDFDDNYTAQCEFQIWSVCRSLGMSVEQACGVLGCFVAESQCHPEAVEGLFGYMTSDYSEIETYIEDYSSKYAENSTDVTNDVLSLYGGGTNNSAYFINGVGYCGTGTAQFTGGRSKLLLEFCEANNCDWWVMENQLSWALLPADQGGDSRSSVWFAYIEETRGLSVNECTEYWIDHYENADMDSNERTERKTYANNFYADLKDCGWDESYGSEIVSGAGLTPSSMHDGINDKGILQSYANTVLYYPQNTGFILDNEKTAELEAKNVEIYKGLLKKLNGVDDTSTKYSLFELYGEDLRWYRYMGEQTYAPTLLDHIWCAIDQHKVDDLVSFDTIDYEAPVYLSCQVYNERPEVLTSNDIDNGYKDPRVTSYSTGFFNGYSYVLGSFYMTIAKYTNSIMSLLMGDELTNLVFEIIEGIESTAAGSTTWKGLQAVILVFVGLAMLGFIISIVGKSIKYAKANGSLKEVIERFLIGFCCLGLLFMCIYNPTVFNKVLKNSLNVVDDFFQAALADSKQIKEDEVICVSDPDYVMQAALWKTGIFNAWCRGQFDNLEYEQLYTNYATDIDPQTKSRMPQSFDIPDPANTNGTPVYNSTDAIGDVYVYVGGGTEIRNWAAYLYSCGTKYHIDYTVDSDFAKNYDTSIIDDLNVSFPNAKTCATNSLLMADTFRIVDAQMDISPQLFPDGSTSKNYAGAHKLKTHFMAQGNVMLFNAALLFMFLPVIWQKFKNFVLIMITPFQIIWFTLLELFKENNNIKKFTDTFIKAFASYFAASLKINIMILFYITFVDKGIFMTIMFILLSLVLLGFNVQDAKRFIRNSKDNIKRFKNSF